MARLRGLRGYFPHNRMVHRFQVLPDEGCLFVKNPKAGTTAILLWMHRLHARDPGFQPTRPVRTEIELPLTGEIGMKRVVRMLNHGEVFRFAFVRHPCTRLESAYRSKIMTNRAGRRLEVQRVLGLPVGGDHNVSFEQFVDSLGAVPAIDQDLHWRPQHLNLMHPKVTYDLVGRIENLEADLRRVSDALGLPPVDVDVRNASARTGPLLEGRPDLVRKVETLYARDFELYGY